MKHPILFTSLSSDELTSLMEASVRKAIGTDTKQTEQDTLLTTRQASALICYKESTLYGLAKASQIPHMKVRGKLLFSRKSLLDWIAAPARHDASNGSTHDANAEKEATR